MREKRLIKELRHFGFSTAQASLYLAGLRLGKTLMAHLAKAAQVRRTTAYYLIEELKRRRFFSAEKIGRRTYYIATSPQQLLTMAKERERLVRKILPVLKLIVSKR